MVSTEEVTGQCMGGVGRYMVAKQWTNVIFTIMYLTRNYCPNWTIFK